MMGGWWGAVFFFTPGGGGEWGGGLPPIILGRRPILPIIPPILKLKKTLVGAFFLKTKLSGGMVARGTTQNLRCAPPFN